VTDVGLWALARHCTTIKGLNLSKCDAVTKVGLRSLSLRCQQLQDLNFDHCEHIDDQVGVCGSASFVLFCRGNAASCATCPLHTRRAFTSPPLLSPR
jgi:hypothetical protein